MPEFPQNIIEFIEHPDLLDDRSHSDWQQVILKSTYGLPLNQNELEIYQHGTGREIYDANEQRESTIIGGRRSGKTSKVATPIALFEAFRDHGLPAGEEAFVVLLAPQIKQARIALRYIRNYLRRSRILSKRVVSTTKDEIKLDNGITIGCYPCSYVAVRGITIVAVICDEMAFWPHDESSANPEEEILSALRPCMATIIRPKLIKISTPYRKEGLLWTEFQRRNELDFSVWQAPSFQMNPKISPAFFNRERERDEPKFHREYMAEFSENITSWIDPETLEACVIRTRWELPRVPNSIYVAAIDPAFKQNDFALAIVHLSPDGTVVLDRVERWRGTKTAPLSFASVRHEIKSILDQYDLNSVIGDQYCATVIREQLLELSIYYRDFAFGSHTRADIFGNLRHLLVQRKIELLADPELLRQFRNLEERRTDRGQVDIRPSGGIRDDLAVAVALAASKLAKEPEPSVFLGPLLGIERSLPAPYFIPGICPFEAICKNFPLCHDEGCQGFDDERSQHE